MTKGSQVDLGPKSDKEDKAHVQETERRDSRSLHTLSISSFSSNGTTGSSEKKLTRQKIKRKSVVTSSKSSISSIEKKKKCNKSLQKTSESSEQKKLPSNLARLAPLLNRSCPSNLLLVASSKTNEEEPQNNKENLKFEFTGPDLPAPRQQRFQGGTSKRVQIFERQTKNKSNCRATTSSSAVARDTTPNSNTVEVINSSPNLLVQTLCEKGKQRHDLGAASSSQALASEFPDVVRFYRKDFSLDSSKLPYSLKSREGFRFWSAHLNQSLLSLKGNWGIGTPYSITSLGTASSLSAPNTPPLQNNCTKFSTKLREPIAGVATSDSQRGALVLDPTTLSLGLGEKGVQSSKSAADTGADNKSTDTLNSCTLSLITSVKNAMNANQKNTQPLLQYQTGRPKPRVGSNFSSSFILPYGLGNRVQSSPVTTPAVPSSSSFHGGPLESLQLMSENHQRAVRQQSHCGAQRQQRKFLERQKMKMLKPLSVNKNQNNIAKLYDISTSEFSAAILPDPGTTSYRLTHDVSFDEGSRYRTNDFPHGLKGKDEPRAQQNGLNGLSHQFGSAVTMRGNDPPGASGQSRLEGRMPHGANNSFKDSVPLSLIRMEDRCDLPPATSPSSPAMSSAIAASTSNSSFMPPPSASQRNAPSATAMHGSNITFRLHKEKQNWNYRLGDLSINGGGYSNATPTMSNPKQELESINPLNMTTAVQRNLQTRERASAAAPKSRLSTRYSSKFESSNGATYADPCISAPPSFQQRLTDLSILESETVKYERNRKLRRKKNQDKDS